MIISKRGTFSFDFFLGFIFIGVLNFSKIETFNNETVSYEKKTNYSSRHESGFKGNATFISLNNTSNEGWYASLIAVIDIQSFLNTPSEHGIENITFSNGSENETFGILTGNFDCVISESMELNISCVDIDFYLIGEYLPNETIVLDLSYGNQMKLLKPLFPHLKSLRSLTLSHNHHRYITRAFMGLENLKILDLSNNDIIVIANAFSYVPRLRSLSLASNDIRRIRTISKAVAFLENLENLTLDHNAHINYLEKEDLYELKNCNISLFSIFNTTLQNVEKGSFSFLPRLRILEISVNYLNEEALANITCGIGENVEILHFGEMLRIKEFPTQALKCLTNVKVKEMYLWYNYFSKVPVIPDLPYLQTLSFSNCSIKDIEENAFENIPNIKVIFLKGNKLSGFPTALSSVSSLEELYLESQNSDFYNEFFLGNGFFKNLTSLNHLSLARLRIETLTRYCLKGLKNLKYLFLPQAFLYNVEDYAFETLTSLELLDLRGNGLKILTNFTFYGLNNLKYLYLVGNVINFFDSVYPFQYSPSLSIVFLQYNNIEFLPEGIFLIQENLKVLTLGRNKLGPWSKRVLHSKARLKMLELAQNNIDYVSETMLDEFHQVTEYLDLGKNPFNCSKCGMKKFQSFCLETNLSLKIPIPQANDNVYNCMNPQVLHSRNFFEVELPEITCSELGSYILNMLTAIIACFTMIFVLGLVLICHSFRWYIRYWIFHAKTNFIRKTSKLGEKNYMYDAFIIYSSCDTAWVVSHLVPALENQKPHYKLCIHERDFQVGKPITENILDAIENSRKVILILTEGFIKSEWCMYELHLAQHKLFGDTRDILLLAKLQTIDKKLYSKNLSYIEKTRNCFQWTDSHIGQKLFWNQIRKHLGQPKSRENLQTLSKC